MLHDEEFLLFDVSSGTSGEGKKPGRALKKPAQVRKSFLGAAVFSNCFHRWMLYRRKLASSRCCREIHYTLIKSIIKKERFYERERKLTVYAGDIQATQELLCDIPLTCFLSFQFDYCIGHSDLQSLCCPSTSVPSQPASVQLHFCWSDIRHLESIRPTYKTPHSKL